VIQTAHRDLLTRTYAAFVARDIDAVVAVLHPNVDWPNGWEGGRLYGRDAVREYWLRQWAAIDPHVEPMSFETDETGRMVVTVHQVVRDLNGQVMSDEIVRHVYVIGNDGLVVRMDINSVAETFEDDDLVQFEAAGATPLPVADAYGHVMHAGARIWYATHGSGRPAILLHGGLGHSGNWGYQVPALVRDGYRAVVIDTRGHGRSTRDEQSYTYELLASDVRSVMDALHLERAALIGWSDGACTALVLASETPERVRGVLFFGCNMDPGGVKEFRMTPIIGRCFHRHADDYARLSATPDQFNEFVEAVSRMQRSQPNYSVRELSEIAVPVTVVHSEFDEFIKREHAEYLARSIPGGRFVLLKDVSHFAPLQRPAAFNSTMLEFLHNLDV
jgi:pimeloyl-ACP methyl ester carboxylesterase